MNDRRHQRSAVFAGVLVAALEALRSVGVEKGECHIEDGARDRGVSRAELLKQTFDLSGGEF